MYQIPGVCQTCQTCQISYLRSLRILHVCILWLAGFPPQQSAGRTNNYSKQMVRLIAMNEINGIYAPNASTNGRPIKDFLTATSSSG